MILRRPHPITRVIPLALAACLILLALPGVGQADDTADPVRTTITGLAPVALGTSSSVSLSGTIANTGVSEITSLSVRLILSASPIVNRQDLRSAANPDGPYLANPLYGTTTPVVDSLAVGAIANYRVVVDTDELYLDVPGVYVIGIEAVGFGANGYAVLDTERTLIPYVPQALAPVSIAWLWPLATIPSQAPDDVILGDSIPRDIAPNGRLNKFLTAGEAATAITWVVDSQLLQVASDMSDGYLVDRAGRVRAGTRADAAAALLARTRELFGPDDKDGRTASRTRSLWVLPYADPDAGALDRARLTTDLVRAITSAPTITQEHLDRPPDGTLAWAASSRPTQSSLDVLGSAGVRALVVSDKAAPATLGLGYTPSGFAEAEAAGDPLRLLVVDPGLSKALALPQAGQAAVLSARQLFLSEVAFVALEPTTETRYLVAAPSHPRWAANPQLLRSILASLRSTPWTRLVPASRILALPATESNRSFQPRISVGRQFDRRYLDRLIAIQEGIESLRMVLAEPMPVTGPLSSALLRAESSAWRSRPRQGVRLLDSIDASISSTTGMVYVVPRDAVVLSGDSGSVPVTVSNDLDQPVRVGLTLTAVPAVRLDSQPLPMVDIEAGRRASLEVPVRVIGGEALTVSVQLTDPSGAPFGEPVALELRTTAYSRAALWVAVAAAAVLLLLVVFDIVRRARQRGARRHEVAT